MEEEKRNEAALKYNEQFIGGQESRYAAEDFIAGANWQKEQMYSEEEVIALNLKYMQEIGKPDSNWVTFKDWFEKFICNNLK